MEQTFFAKLPLLEECQVLVAGAGPAGLCAAVSAAREGCDVLLIEKLGSVGGALTAGHIRTCMGGVSDGTMRDEMGKLLGTEGACIPHDTEKAKYRLALWLKENGVRLLLGACVCGVTKEASSVTGVVVATADGLMRIDAKEVIDATGDGTVAVLAGVPFEKGRESDGLMQPASILYTIAGVESDLVCTHESDDTLLPDSRSYLALCKEAHLSGELPKNVDIVRLYGGAAKDERLVNANQLCYVDGTSPADIAASDLELRRQIDQVTNFLRNNLPGFEHCRVLQSGEMPGFRETRRLEGRERLEASDISSGRKREDVLVHNALFCFDTHNPDGGGQAEDLETARAVKPYDIPFGCFVPKEIRHLLFAGRCISGSHKAHSSYRVMNICMAMGEAVGLAAALAVAKKIPSCEMKVSDIQQKLEQRGVCLFDSET